MSLGTIGKYERLAVLGHGASGIVYLARDILLRRQVAIKEVSAQGEERERLLEEARVLDRLRHPNIVEVHGVDTIDGKIIIDMEYVDGENLLEILRRAEGEPLAIADAVHIAAQVCDGLAYAQSRHIVHRDIKPANILITRSGDVKLVDFGLAQVLGTNSFVGGAGTYAYMAPEDFDEESASGAQADIWAVGIILYEMLTGRRPFTVMRAKDPFAWKRAIAETPIIAPDQLRPEIPPALAEICLTALARERDERFRTAGTMASALREFIGAWGLNRARQMVDMERKTVDAAPTLLDASDLDGFLDAAADHWEAARAALATGHLARWLWAIGEAPLAEVAQRASEEADLDASDQDALLREFLYQAGFDTKQFAQNAASSGASALRAENYNAAAADYMQAIRFDPTQPTYFLQLYKALIGAGDTASAAATIARGLEFHPRDRALRREHDQLFPETSDDALPHVSPQFVDFGIVRHGAQVKARVTVRSPAGGSGTLQGRIASLPAWLEATPMTFVTRHQQPIALVASSAQLWQRAQEYNGLIALETNAGMIEIPVKMAVKPPRRSFQESAVWFVPLAFLALAPLLAGEVATLRHTHHTMRLPYYSPGMTASGLLFFALWKLCGSADSGPLERLFTIVGALLAPLGVWLFIQNPHSRAIWPALLLAAIPTGLLLVLEGISLLNNPQKWGRWGWAIGFVALLVTALLWKQSDLAVSFS